MIKKLYHTGVRSQLKVLFSSMIFAFGLTNFAIGQACVPGNFTGHGVHPDSAQGFAPGYANQPYSQLVTIVVPLDTLFIPWDSTVLVDILGLPNGFTYACWNNAAPNTRCRWKRNTTGCAIITGNPTIADTGTYPLIMHTKNYLGGNTSPNPYTISYYKIKINAPLGIINLDPNKFMVGDCSPNPFNNKTEINFNSPDQKPVSIKVYNLIGVEVFSTSYRPTRGINQFNFERNALSSGIYVYSISNGEQTFSKRMVIGN